MPSDPWFGGTGPGGVHHMEGGKWGWQGAEHSSEIKSTRVSLSSPFLSGRGCQGWGSDKISSLTKQWQAMQVISKISALTALLSPRVHCPTLQKPSQRAFLTAASSMPQVLQFHQLLELDIRSALRRVLQCYFYWYLIFYTVLSLSIVASSGGKRKANQEGNL